MITIAQVIGGILSGSLALISDALHNFSDVLSLVFSYIANVLSNKKASLNQTFGYKRAEIIAAFVNSITLMVVAIIFNFRSFASVFESEPIKSNLVIWLSLLGIVVNGLSAYITKKRCRS